MHVIYLAYMQYTVYCISVYTLESQGIPWNPCPSTYGGKEAIVPEASFRFQRHSHCDGQHLGIHRLFFSEDLGF